MTRRALLLYNPGSGRLRLAERRVQRIVEEATSLGMQVTPVSSLEKSSPLTDERLKEHDLLILCGGDGTIHYALEHLARTDIPMALLPTGTANVLARELAIPRDPIQALQLVREGHPLRVQLGRGGNRHFHLMAGIGPDGLIINRTSALLKQRLGIGAYWWTGFRELPHLPLRPIRVESEGHSVEATFVVISNSRYYGGHLQITPEADPTEAMLDVCAFTSHSKARFLAYLAGSLRGRHVNFPDVHYFKTKRLRVQGDPAVLVQMDGEVIGQLPMNFEVAGTSIQVFVPLQTVERLRRHQTGQIPGRSHGGVSPERAKS